MTARDIRIDNLIADYLRAATPKTIHQMAMEWNWDTSDHFFDFVADTPHTDKATILMIYWMAGPGFDKQFTTKEEAEKAMGSGSVFELLEKIESRYQHGFYTSSRFFYDPNTEDHTGTVWAEQDADTDMARPIPDIMFQKLEGEVISTNDDFDEGIPPDLLAQMEALK